VEVSGGSQGIMKREHKRATSKENARMSSIEEKPVDVDRAQHIWDDYLATHDVSDRIGKAAGIDPETGQIWFGESMIDIIHQMDAARCFKPLFYVRVGYRTYWRKGGRH